MKVGIIGATGYVGQQLVGLLLEHPKVDIAFLSSRQYSGVTYEEVYGHFKDLVKIKCIPLDQAMDQVDQCDCLFIALPHGKSVEILETLKDKKIKVIDFGGDFRMNNPQVINEWYDCHHKDVALLESVVYGLPEMNGDKIAKSQFVANPGCYPTASLLGLLPIIDKDFVHKSSIIIDGKSAVTGAGRKELLAFSYCEMNENTKAYSVGGHRHTPEIEEMLKSAAGESVQVTFTPHLVPMQRGLLITAYVQLKDKVELADIQAIYEAYYKDKPFVRLVSGLSESKHVARTNYCDIGLFHDGRTNKLIVVSVIDNLIKGSAGEAIQNMNLMMGYPETLGLEGNQYYL